MDLRALVKEEIISEPFRGQYVYRPSEADILADPFGREGVHGLVLVSGVLREGIPRPVFLRDPRFKWSRKHGFRYEESILDWQGRRVQIWYYPRTRRFRVNVPVSRNPIAWTELGDFQGWLSGILYPIEAGRLGVVEIGVNVDRDGWRLEGVKAVSLAEFRNATERLYQKRDGIRHEIHSTYRNLSLDRAVQILKEGSELVRMERLIEKELELERLRRSSSPESPQVSRRPPDSTGFA